MELFYSVFVVHDSWHAALVCARAISVENTIPELADFPAAEMIEFSWCDSGYFAFPNSGVFRGLKAFWSTAVCFISSALTVRLKDFYRAAEIVELRLSKDALRAPQRFHCRRI